MKPALHAFWKGLASRFLTLTAAIVVVMLCAVIFASRQVPSSVSAPAAVEGAVVANNQSTPQPQRDAFIPGLPAVAREAPPSPSPEPQPATSYEYVHGYTKKDGTVVPGYYRTKADGDKSNNWSEKGNVNPFTGKPGTQGQ